MPIEFEVASLDSVEEGIRKAYVEKDGKFTLDVERYGEIRAEPLLRKNQELLREKKELEESTRTLEQKSKSGLSDVEKQLQEKDREIANLKGQVREHSIWTPVRTLAAKHGVLPDRIDAVMTLLRAENRFDLEQTSLLYRDKHGNPTDIKPDRAFEVYLREEIPWAFEASKAAGSGAQNGNRSAGTRTITRGSFEAMSEAAKSQALKDGARIID